jgi:pancreatic triacylglycerol lipase
VPVNPIQLIHDCSDGLHLVNLEAYEEEEWATPRFDASQDIIYTLFTRQNPTVGQVLPANNAGVLLASNFNPAHPTR